MPHVIYLHSALTQRRVVGATAEARSRIFRFELVDVIIAMSIAGVVNMAMLITAAAVFHAHGYVGVEGIQRASHVLGRGRRPRRHDVRRSRSSRRGSRRRRSARWPARS